MKILFTRKVGRRSTLWLAGFIGIWFCVGAHGADVSREQLLNSGWKFTRVEETDTNSAGPEYQASALPDGDWESVTLPHTAHIEAAKVQYVWQGVCWYRKRLPVDAAWHRKRVSIEFGAGMGIADVWVNGKAKSHHLGGYLPFTVDVTSEASAGGEMVIAVRLDNRDTQLAPPGKPMKALDFEYPGGLYRGAKLIVTSPVHVTDSIVANVEAGGGVFVTYENVSQTRATVRIKTHVINEGSDGQNAHVISRLIGPDGIAVQAKTEETALAAREARTFEQTIDVLSPKLWDPDHPSLYTLQSRVIVNGTEVEQIQTRLGIRDLKITDNGLVLNGKRLDICGSNRHQEYPYLEYAISPEAAWRDARLIKEGGFNYVRLCHYPQDPAFISACDELGLLVQEPIPGWQQFWNNESFIAASQQNERDMIRRDRNHPSIVLWETSLNETRAAPVDFRRTSQEIAHKEFPGDQCFTWGDSYSGSLWDIKDGMLREYGDWAFGGNKSTSRQSRGDGGKAMLQQAWNFLWTFNYLRRPSTDSKHVYMGSATWVMFDYNRGANAEPCTCGMMDIFRLPKYVYYFYQSQRDPRVVRQDIGSGPMVFIANQWKAAATPEKVVVFSNCDEVELLINGKVIGRQKPDGGPDTSYSQGHAISTDTMGTKSDRTGGNPFDGGNCRNLAHPPFTFNDVTWAAGSVKAMGYINGKQAAFHEVRTPGKPAALRVQFDTVGVDLRTGGDEVFVRAVVVDASGTVVSDATPAVKLTVAGPAALVGANPVNAEAGIASLLLQAGGEAGQITVTATAEGLPPASGVIFSKEDTRPAVTTNLASGNSPRATK